MRNTLHHFYSLMIVLALLALPVVAKDYLSREQALKLAFPDADAVKQVKVAVSKEQQKAIRELTKRDEVSDEFAYHVGTKKGQVLGYAVIDDVKGKAQPITYLLAVEPNGAVRMVEILAYRESHGGEVRQKSFLNQFKGKTTKSKLRLKEDIRNIAGATISCRAVTDGVRLQLAYLTVLAPLEEKKAQGTDELQWNPGTSGSMRYASFAGEPRSVTRAQYLMGTLLEIRAYAPDRAIADRAMNRAFAEVARLEALHSTYQPESEISRLNRIPVGETMTVSPDTMDLLQRCRQFTELTDGAFDVTVGPLVALWRQAAREDRLPTAEAISAAQQRTGIAHVALDPDTRRVHLLRAGVQVDFGGVGKGYALDRAAAVLRANGIDSALLNFGGQVLVTGLPPGQPYWTIEVRDPHDPWNPDRPLTTLRLAAGSVSTSADYARGLTIQGQPYSHILDPRTGQPVAGMLSATIAAPTATEVDALSTALYVLGPKKGRQLAEERGLAVLLVAEKGAAYRSAAFRNQEALQVALSGTGSNFPR